MGSGSVGMSEVFPAPLWPYTNNFTPLDARPPVDLTDIAIFHGLLCFDRSDHPFDQHLQSSRGSGTLQQRNSKNPHEVQK
jgi:lipopolysaccharide biosynthesis protein